MQGPRTEAHSGGGEGTGVNAVWEDPLDCCCG